MAAERWQNLSPGDLSITLPEVESGEVSRAVETAAAAAPAWAATPLGERVVCLRRAQEALVLAKERLARGIADELYELARSERDRRMVPAA